MKRLTVFLLAILAYVAPVLAQNNPYRIDDTCYEYFSMAETLFADTENEAFEYVNAALLKRALEVGDEKARALHYVEKLKRVIRFARMMENHEEGNLMVENQKKETLDVALATGYTQYFYYSYTLCQTYYMNTRQQVHAQAMLQEMMEVATRNGDEYGIWQSHVYIATLFQHQNDILNARKHLLHAVNMYETTNNETLGRQSIARQYFDLAETYTAGSDSARMYLRKAEETIRTHQDTMRNYFFKAQLAAIDHDIANYRKYRDICLEDDNLPVQINTAEFLFPCVDAIIGNAPKDSIITKAVKTARRTHVLFLMTLAIAYNREDVASWLGSWIILLFYTDISLNNNLKMEELTSSVQARQLTVALNQQKRRNTILWIVIGILGAGLIATLVAFLLEKKKKHYKQ